MLDSLEIQIAIQLLRKFETNIKRESPLLHNDYVYIRMATEYIQDNFNSDINIKDICENIHVSPYHFIRMFKKETGLTPYYYLIFTRIEKAKELLSAKHFSISETAELCGFNGISHFSSTFKKMTGYSPVDYRNHYVGRK
jgi:AraC-like DNA-binding protein